ncbi:MAG: AI-2E family transporter [Methanoculleus sp.]|uniref:AI-2E family transporter n=1 Tax=unclassified Methanoculleus TaxID=2619537 RepID=UPI0025DE0D04|nr:MULTISPECIES: AI-2E family transporter [unclassified Methanoculleus]MCK9318502.1 AI-2E family transporter [Methanoculleus sp.]MDD2253568.1 AI-2E family transporter [Methanoculleus sp.]MDD3215150.1 AI-2E family transporter [Methanoculleus sp.]MDD4313163.1 AI-2E family transporter [Methanoculleus sp.]MDD4470470.1 AI-2E family transporter [Methanoculleus sp.]
MAKTPVLPRPLGTVVLLTAAIFLIIGIQAISYIVTLIVVSMILAMIAYPAAKALRKRGLPEGVAVGVVAVIASLLLLLICYTVLFSFESLIADLPLYQQELTARLSEALAFLDRSGIETGSFSPSAVSLERFAGFLSSSAVSIADLLLYLFFIAVTTIFMLLEAPRMPERLRKVTGDRTETVEAFSRMSRFLIDFVIVRTEANLVHGFLFGAFLWGMGVHSAILWGVLTFLLAYIPYIGLIVAALPAVFFAWLQFGPWGAIAVIAAVAILNALVENPIFAHFASRRFDIPALVVILSVIFWGWALGVAGMIFAVPLTLIVLMLLQASEDWAWVNTLLGVDHLFMGVSPGEGSGVGAPEAR